MAQHTMPARGRHARDAGAVTIRTAVRAAVAVAVLMLAVAVGHNVSVYHGSDQLIGWTWGQVGGCEVTTVDRAVSAGCWLGGRD